MIISFVILVKLVFLKCVLIGPHLPLPETPVGAGTTEALFIDTHGYKTDTT